MTEISNEMMSGNGEPLIVGTNTTLNYDATENSNLTYDTESQPLAVGTNLTIEITYAEAELLKEQLGIDLDGSDDYLGSNVTVIDGDRDWLERIDNNPFGGEEMSSPTTESVSDSYSWDLEGAEEIPADDGENEEELATEVSFSSNSSEPLLVGTNITFFLKEDTDGSSDENESLSERDEEMPFALGTNLLLELPDEDGQDSYLGTNLSTMQEDSETQTNAMEGDSFSGDMMPTESANPMSENMEGDSFSGGMMPTGVGNQPSSDNDDYAWDFGGQLDRFSTDDSGGMEGNIDPDALFAASPWGGLTETGAVDGFEDVFPNAAGAMDSNTFAGGFGGGEI